MAKRSGANHRPPVSDDAGDSGNAGFMRTVDAPEPVDGVTETPLEPRYTLRLPLMHPVTVPFVVKPVPAHPYSNDGGRTVDSTAVNAAGMRIEYGRGAGFNEYGYRIVPK